MEQVINSGLINAVMPNGPAAKPVNVDNLPFAVVRDTGFGPKKKKGTPSVRVTFNRPPRGTEFTDFLKKLASYYEHKVRYQMFFEPKNIGIGALVHVPSLVRYMRDYEEQHRAYLVRTAVYTRSEAVKAFITATFKIKTPVSEIKVFNDKTEAYNYMGWADQVRKAMKARRA